MVEALLVFALIGENLVHFSEQQLLKIFFLSGFSELSSCLFDLEGLAGGLEAEDTSSCMRLSSSAGELVFLGDFMCSPDCSIESRATLRCPGPASTAC